MEESLTAVEVNCDRVFHVTGMVHISVMKLLIARVPLNEMMASTIELLAKHVEFGPKSHGVEIMQGILQLIKCLRGQTLAANPETIFDDADFSEPSSSASSSSSSALLAMLSKHAQTGKPAARDSKGNETGSGAGRCDKNMKKKKKLPVITQSNSMYQILVALAAFIFGHYAYVEEISSAWHDDPRSVMNLEGSWIVHTVFTIVGLTLSNLLRIEKDPEVRRRHKERLFCIHDRMEVRANKSAINNAAMYYLLKAEIADQALVQGGDEQGDDSCSVKDLKTVLLLYEKAIQFSIEGDFPMQKCFAHEFSAQCHLRHGLVTSARCLMRYACEEYRVWGAKGKVQWFYHTFPDIFPSTSQEDFSRTTTRGLFYRPSEKNYGYTSRPGYPLPAHNSGTTGASSSTGSLGFNLNSTRVSSAVSSVSTNTEVAAAVGNGGSTSPWKASSSPSLIYNTPALGYDAVSAAGVAMAESNMAPSHHSISGGGAVPVPANAVSNASSSMASHPSASSSTCSPSYSSLSAPLYSLQNTWLNSPLSPETDNTDFDVLDFSSVIEAMQVIASEIDLDLLLVKSLGVLNQSVGAKRCCVLITKDDELVLAASLGVVEDGSGDNDIGQCWFVNPPMEVKKCGGLLFHGMINYVVNTSATCLLTNAKDDPRFCADEYLLKQRPNLKTVLCAPILHKAVLVGVLYMEEFPERAFANKRMVVMNLLVQQLGISITNALLYQSVLQSESKLNGLLENMPCGIALWDATAEKCQYLNSTWGDMTGYTVEEILQSGWKVLVHEDEIVQYGLTWKGHVHAGVPCQWECRYGLKDGTFRWGIVRMLPIVSTSEPNKILQWLTVTIDIDDQRRAVQLKSNFLANMSHELRTPFSGILGMLSLLKDSSGLSSEQFEFVDMAKASCEMLIRIVDDLLNFSKLEADKVTLEYIPLCFEEILGDVCDLLVPLASKKGLELIMFVDDTLPALLIGDPDRMKQILMNLIGNAIKFSTSGNIVIKYWHERRKRDSVEPMQVASHEPLQNFLDAKYTTQDQVLQTSSELQDMDESQLGDEIVLHCSVTDQGIGMSPEEQKMLFVSFQQTDSGTTRKYGGTGLGLSICAQLIAHMKGQITVESEKGHGSTFTFTANLRSTTDYDREQNAVESARISDGESLLNARWDALSGKRVLILSPNRLLREQIIRAAPKAEYMEFDDLVSAVKAGAIGVHCENLDCNPNMTVEEANTSENKDRGSACCVSESSAQGINLGMDTDSNTCSSKSKTVNCKLFGALGPMPKTCFARLQELFESSVSQEQISQFDFILVDHFLDSAELDCIYPPPSAAFVLLLGPTTETLRWILPPAEKQIYEELDERDSSQADVGGRGRIQQGSELELAEKAKGRTRSTSHMTEVAKSSDCPMYAEGNEAASIFSAGAYKLPSQLFKRKKPSGDHSADLKRQRGQGCSTGSDGDSSNVNHSRSDTGSSSPSSSSSFQVVRMIKPVRRMKLLQIMHNALVSNEDQQQQQREMLHCDYEGGEELEQHEDQEPEDQAEFSEASSDECSEDEELIEGEGTPGERSQTVTSGTLSSSTLSRSTSPTSFLSVPQYPTPQKRRRSKDSERTECIVSNNVTVPPYKAAKAKASPVIATMSSKWTAVRSRASTCSSSLSRDQQDEKQSHMDGSFPKRARNNDALTLLLTSEERKRSQGINVLVAEDDFVSQKILEKQLSKLGMNVVIAKNGQEAVDQWLAVERGYYTIAIFDHHMPIMDGLAATKKIRALEAAFAEEDEKTRAQGDGSPSHQIRIPIVGLSADIQLATKEKCIKGGMDEYMTKPLLTQGLALLIQRYCCG
ncbi:histidine kinase osmosensor [Mortierella polycephala]|uniref:Histidine kinase osmosensor n=1 Tax=Mortierella polycephala TaxID=41804 RepID=A0A9P6TXE0_9FUNG|nr:histidine kinase osmosensor [Mortierella polycephala]